MLRVPIYALADVTLRASGWLQYGRQYDAPVRPDRLLWLDPCWIEQMPVTKPHTGRFPPTLVVGGGWDLELEPLRDDIVYRTFHERFVEGKPWQVTGYVEFLQSDMSEHGGRFGTEALERCQQLDDLYQYIAENGYRTQTELERDGSLIDGLSGSKRPPTYREIAVNVTRDGEFVWHAGMHRLVIAKLLDLEEIPVRINTRHAKWQAIRDAAYNGDETEYDDHPDVAYLVG